MVFNNVNDVVSFVAERLKDLPEWQRKLYQQYAEEIQVHSRGELFYKIDNLFPNEHPMSKEHRVLAFESVTKGSFWKGVNNVIRIFQNSSYSLEASENTVEFVSDHNFDKQNLFSFFLEKWCNTALADDCNSIVAVYPFEYVKAKNVPQVVIIPSKHVKYIDSETIVFISEDESEKKYDLSSGRITQTVYDNTIGTLNMIDIPVRNTLSKRTEITFVRKVYHVFTLQGFYRVAQKEDSSEYDFAYWMHNKNFLPCFTVGGMDAGHGVFQSFFSVFCPFGNLALLQHSQHTAVNFTFSFPRMSEIEVPCDAIGCNGGFVTVEYSPDFPSGKKPCEVCLGVGYTTNQTPYKTYKRRFDADKFDNGTIQALNFDDVKFYTPDTNILNYSKEEWKDYLELAEQTVYVPQPIKTGNVQSAKSKEIDREDRYNFLSKIAKVFYDRLRTLMQCFENYLNANPIDISINIPYSFAIESEMEAFEALQVILISDAPIIIKANKVETFINKFVSQSSPVRRFFTILKKIDLLLFYSDSQIQGQKIGGVVTVKQWAVHVYAFPVLSRMFYEDRTIFDLQDDQIIVKLEAELQPYMPNDNMLKATLVNTLNKPQIPAGF